MRSVPVQVWAPCAHTVAAVVHGTTLPLQAGSNGWWVLPAGLPDGTDYAFVLDGGDPLPDPRSAYQPDGVHGPSQAFDASSFDWSDEQWTGLDVRGAVIYELHIGTFTPAGTLLAAIDRLSYLADLGVDVVQLMPVAAFEGDRGWGYDGVGLYAVHAAYGGPQALQAFVDAAHGHGLAVALDVVYNHLGPSGNYLGSFGPYFTDAHATPWGQAVNLDQDGSDEVRAFIIDAAKRWVTDFHIDALRLDAVHELRDSSTRHVLAELSDEIARVAVQYGRPLSLIAESDLNDVVMVTPTNQGGLGMTAQWDDDVHHAIHAFLTGERHGYYADFGTLETLVAALRQVFVHNGTFSSFRGTTWGAPVPDEVDRHCFVVSTSTHDQVGNRGLGDRPPSRLTAGQCAIATALLLTTPFTPMLFMGEEWGSVRPFQFFTDFGDPQLAQAVREGRAREFGEHGWDQIYGPGTQAPDPQSVATYRSSQLDWDELTVETHARHLAWTRTLLALRQVQSDLTQGGTASMDISFDAEDGWLILHRGTLEVIINTSTTEQVVPLPDSEPRTVLASWGDVPSTALAGAATMAGHDVLIVGRR